MHAGALSYRCRGRNFEPMAEVAFDTLALARRLRDHAGFSQEHAEETARAIADSMSGQVATKTDIAELCSELTRLILTVATGQVALLLAAMFSLARFTH